MDDTIDKKKNGLPLAVDTADFGSEISAAEALEMRRACVEWLRVNDPQYIAPDRFRYGTLHRRQIRPRTPAV